MNGMPIVSVIIPVYNAQSFLDICLSSVSKQTYSNLEILVVNDGSTDDSLSICQKWVDKDSRFILINKPNGGVSSARNMALLKATGDYFLFLDSDDYLEKNMIEKLLGMISETGSQVAFAGIRLFDNQHSVISHAFTDVVISDEMAIRQCYQKASWILAIWGKLFSRASLCNDSGLILFDESLSIGEDYLWLIAVLSGNPVEKVCCCPDALYNYRRFDDEYSLSNFRNRNYLKKKKDLLKAGQKCIDILADNKDLEALAIRRLVSDYINGEVVIYGLHGKAEYNEYRDLYYLVKPFLASNRLELYLKLKVVVIHHLLAIHFPRIIVRKMIDIVEDKRKRKLYM